MANAASMTRTGAHHGMPTIHKMMATANPATAHRHLLDMTGLLCFPTTLVRLVVQVADLMAGPDRLCQVHTSSPPAVLGRVRDDERNGQARAARADRPSQRRR